MRNDILECVQGPPTWFFHQARGLSFVVWFQQGVYVSDLAPKALNHRVGSVKEVLADPCLDINFAGDSFGVDQTAQDADVVFTVCMQSRSYHWVLYALKDDLLHLGGVSLDHFGECGVPCGSVSVWTKEEPHDEVVDLEEVLKALLTAFIRFFDDVAFFHESRELRIGEDKLS